MKQRCRTGASVKSRRRTAAALKGRNRAQATRPRSSSATSHESEAARLASELSAMSEILRLISNSPSDVTAVLQSVAEQAAQICRAQYVDIFIVENDNLRNVAWFGEIKRTLTFPLDRSSASGRSVCDMRPVSVDDVQNAGDEFARGREFGRRGGHRSIVAVPLTREGRALGTILVSRTEVRPFEQKHIDLLASFAAQAVIAIENARLLSELRESLGRQTATSEVLSVISSSRGDLGPVFHAILENATRICEATFGSMLLRHGDAFRRAALHNAPPQFEEYVKNAPILRRGMAPSVDRLIDTGQVTQTLDSMAEQPNAPVSRYGGARTLLDVPMLKNNEAIGVLGIYRQEVRPFTDKQIALVQNFASQAVIAIENARLLNELRERTAQLEARSQEIAKLNEQLEARVADQVGEIERMGRLRRFLPPQVADLIVALGSERQLESHRREITALFCDLRGFTGFSESSDPEDVMTLLRQYHEAIGKIIIKYSGTLERFAGDGVMVVFNDPVPVDNPALQAVRMALDMRAALDALIETWRRLGHELGFGIGIAHGYATLGTIGFEGRFDYAAIGTVSNVASRLCDEAKPGQILISPRVLMAVEDAVAVEPVGDFALKGISRPLAAYNVVGAK
jgi:adenylate cyclase